MDKSKKTPDVLDFILEKFTPAASWQTPGVTEKPEHELLELIHWKASKQELREFMSAKNFVSEMIGNEPFYLVIPS